MAASARKELAKALRATFVEGGSDCFEGYEPGEQLLQAIDLYATSSDIVQNASERDTLKLKETLLRECFEEGILKREQLGEQDSTVLKARSALIIILDKFASLDSEVVTAKQIIEIWWKRLLQPALISSEESIDRRKAQVQVQVGSVAARAARELVIRALCAKGASSGPYDWLYELFSLYTTVEHDSFAQKNLQHVLVAFGKSHPQVFFSTVDMLLPKSPVQLLVLLNGFVRLHPVNAYQALQTPLFNSMLTRLGNLDLGRRQNDLSHDLAWISSSLTFFSMLLPRIPTSLEKCLDQLFLAFAQCLLWYKDSVQSSAIATGLPEHKASDDRPVEGRLNQHDPNLTTSAPLLDYFTTLYGLFPSNLLYFLTSPIPWLQTCLRRQKKRRRTLTESQHAGDRSDRLHPATEYYSVAPRISGGDTSTSGEDTFPFPGESALETAARVAAAAKKKAKARPHGKGRRSKIQKQKKDALTRARKEKDLQREKEREKRRKNIGFVSGIESEKPALASDVDVQRSYSDSEDAAIALKIRVEKPNVEDQDEAGNVDTSDPGDEDGMRADLEEEETSSSGSLVSEDELTGHELPLELDEAVLRMDWGLVRRLAEVDLSRSSFIVNGMLKGPSALYTPEAEFARIKLRFKKLEASDLVDEITRTRINSSLAGPNALPAVPTQPAPQPNASMSQSQILSLQSEYQDRVLLLQNQLLFETYQEQQLIQRLGALLREHVVAGGVEADRQNLLQNVRSLQKQLSDAQSTLTHVKREANTSRDMLNAYSSSQQKRIEALREEKRNWANERSQLRAELEDAQSSVVILNEKLAEAEKEVFELQSEQKYRKEIESREQKNCSEEVESLRAEVESLKAQISKRSTKIAVECVDTDLPE